MLLPECLEERRFEWFLAATRDGSRQRVQRSERDDIKLVRVRLVPLNTSLSIYPANNGVYVRRVNVRFRHRSSPPSSTNQIRLPDAASPHRIVCNFDGCIARIVTCLLVNRRRESTINR